MNDTTKEIARVLVLANDREEANDEREARRLYARCLELDDGADSDARFPGEYPIRLRAVLRHAAFLRDQGSAREALELARPATERWPKESRFHSVIGGCHADLGEAEEAEAAYRRAVSMEPRASTYTLLYMVLQHQMEGRERDAEACLHAALELDPNYEEAHYNLGCNLRLRGDVQGAIERFRKAIAIDPDYALAHAELGFALNLELGDADGDRAKEQRRIALEHLERSVALDPIYSWSRLYLANELHREGRLRRAGEHYQAVARLKPDWGFALACYADFLSSAYGPTAAAQERFEKAVKLDPDHECIRYMFGKHLLRAGRYDEGRRELLLADRLGHKRALAYLESYDEEQEPGLKPKLLQSRGAPNPGDASASRRRP